VLTGNDIVEMKRIKGSLVTEFEIKDLGPLRYFLGIEVAIAPNGVFISQQKYVLELLHETGMLGCRPTNTPIDPNHGLKGGISDQVDRERYQRLVGRLIYLSHARPDISYAMSVVSR
jgi:Reverse transcriptase (RNA-dependent DNA polymerase)